MSIQRVEQILKYAEAMVECYEEQLSAEERKGASELFTRTDEWPGWATQIGLRPGAGRRILEVVRRSA